MRRTIRVLTAGAVVAGCLAAAGPAWGVTKTVCSSGCPYTSIQAAINAAAPHATITIENGTYIENVVVDKPVTLKGSGTGTVIEPALSDPVCSPGSLCEGAASNIILVQADSVTITNLKLDGDNPGLTSGVVVGGADIDARNGIITNHSLGLYNGLTVSRVQVWNVYLRGIYASSGGTFNFTRDTVNNVQGEAASIAMFAFEGTGRMETNTVSNANDAISANWSEGIQFVGNKVTKSGSGVHTDNNGGSGGAADLIWGNTISECKPDGNGIFVFAPYVSATVEANKVKGCYVGLAVFGSAVSGQGPTFIGNRVNGRGATTTDPAGTYGAYLTTDEPGFGSGDLTATLTGNALLYSGTGMFVTQSAGGQATVGASDNTIHYNGTGANGDTGTTVNAQNNWWGCAKGPNMGTCDTAIGTVSYTPWLTARP